MHSQSPFYSHEIKLYFANSVVKLSVKLACGRPWNSKFQIECPFSIWDGGVGVRSRPKLPVGVLLCNTQITLRFWGRRVFRLSPNSPFGGLSLVGCPQLIIIFMINYTLQIRRPSSPSANRGRVRAGDALNSLLCETLSIVQSVPWHTLSFALPLTFEMSAMRRNNTIYVSAERLTTTQISLQDFFFILSILCIII